jgi:hypothetical protein
VLAGARVASSLAVWEYAKALASDALRHGYPAIMDYFAGASPLTVGRLGGWLGPHKVRTRALHGACIETGSVLFRGPRLRLPPPEPRGHDPPGTPGARPRRVPTLASYDALSTARIIETERPVTPCDLFIVDAAR